MGFLKQLMTNPLSLSVVGWVTFPLVFMIMTFSMMLGLKIEIAFWVLSPIWVLGLTSWVLAFLLGWFYILVGPDRKGAFIAILFSIAPVGIAYLGYLNFDYGLSF